MAEQQSKGTKTLLIILIAVVVVLIVGVTAFAAYYVKNNKQEAKEEEKRQVLITEENAEQEVKDLIEGEENQTNDVVPATYEVVMNTTWHFPNGESPSRDAYVENAKENQTDVYFDLRLSDTQETIYESPVIPLGGKLDEIKLKRILDPGTYDCVLTYHLVDGEQNTLGTIDVVVTVIVEE